jgi:hypothetical protein
MVVGVGCVKPAAVIRDPVTTSSSRASPVPASVAALDASAAPAWTGMIDKTNTDMKQRYKSCLAPGIFVNPVRRPLHGGLLEMSERFEHKHAFTQASIKNTSFLLLLYKSTLPEVPDRLNYSL